MSPSYLKLPSTSKASAQSGVDLTIVLFRTRTAGRSVSDNNATQPSWGSGLAIVTTPTHPPPPSECYINVVLNNLRVRESSYLPQCTSARMPSS